MLARKVSRVIPGGHRQSLDDDAGGGLRRFAPALTPPGASSSAMPRENRLAVFDRTAVK